MQCPHCNEEHPEGIKFCPKTGRKIIKPDVCPQCGKPIDPKWLHCNYCGRKLLVSVGNSDQQDAQATRTPRTPDMKSDPSKIFVLMMVGGFGFLLIATVVMSKRVPSVVQTTTTWTYTPMPIDTPLVMPTFTAHPVSTEELAKANQAFADGALVYLYDPQPETVSLSDLNATSYSLRYILPKDAKAVTELVFIMKVNAEDVIENVVGETAFPIDWASETGVITFSMTMSYAMRNVIDQGLKDQGIVVQHVDDPAYLDILLLAPEERDGGLYVSDSSKQLSNIVRILVTP